MSCKRLKERASHSSSSSLPAKKKCLLTLRQETQSLTNLLSNPEISKLAQVNELSNSEVEGTDSDRSIDVTVGHELNDGDSEDKDQNPTSLSSLKLVQICDTLENCELEFKSMVGMEGWGQQKSPPTSTACSQSSNQENNEPNSRLTPPTTSREKTTISSSDKSRHYHQLQKHQKRKELESMWKAVYIAHQKAFPTCNVGRRKTAKEEQAEKVMVESSITIEDVVGKLCGVIENSYDSVKNFAENIPGFKDFHQGDKNILQQIGGLEVTLLHLACKFDKKTECLQVWDERWLSQETAFSLSKSSSDFTTAVFFELLFSLAESLNSMPLQFHDIAVFSALLLLPSDLQGIQNRAQVEVLQEKVLNCLSACLMSRNRTCFPCLLAQLLMCMPTLRTLSTTYLELTSQKRQDRRN